MRKVYKCKNSDCTNLDPVVQFSDQDHTCPKCNSQMEVDKIASMRGISMDRVPGGYDSEVFNNRRKSRDGQIAEANYLAGESRAAY